MEHLEKTHPGTRLILPKIEGAQAEFVTVPLPYSGTELCPTRALTRWQETAGVTEGPAFRRIWLSKGAFQRRPRPHLRRPSSG
jgi:hypothetical protein